MLGKAWHLLKALLGRQDGRVPVDPEVHASTFGMKSTPAVAAAETALAVQALLASITQVSTDREALDAAAAATRALLTPEAPVASAAAVAPAMLAKHTDFKLASRLAATARLNRPAGKSGRKSGRSVAPAGKAVPKRVAKPATKRVRTAKPQAWIIARKARKPQTIGSARIIAFPAAAARSGQKRLRTAA